MKKICIILFSILLLNICICGVNASKIDVVSDNVNVLTTVNNNRNTAANSNNNNNNSNSNGLELSSEHMTCEQLLGKNLVKVLHVVINAIRIGAAIGAVIIMMTALIPPIMSGDASDMKKATKKCVSTAIVLVIIEFIPLIAGVVGKIAGFDLSCL